jgi:hypothetical protein
MQAKEADCSQKTDGAGYSKRIDAECRDIVSKQLKCCQKKAVKIVNSHANCEHCLRKFEALRSGVLIVA